MATQTQLFVILLITTSLVVVVFANSVSGSSDESKCVCDEKMISRGGFPTGFIFGAASAAYQYEGAYNVDGKGPSNWDVYTHTHPERITDHSNGDVATDSYHRYKDDVCIAKDLGLDAYRFSISWSRILPYGKLNGGEVNQGGIDYYNNLINDLLDKGLEPYATLFHFDLPQALIDAYGGFLNQSIVEDFLYYADTCFYYFGDRVNYWITLNEPWTVSSSGYATGASAPGRCSSSNCTGGDAGTEPYLVAHNQLLAHATAVKSYKKYYQPFQKGKIGITLVSQWFVPFNDTSEDKAAQQRALDFMLGWFLDPITYGEYPDSMRTLVGSRLPNFTEEESEMLRESYDFLGLNYYTTYYALDAPNSSTGGNKSYLTDSQVNQTCVKDGKNIGDESGAEWLYIYPAGIRALLNYVKTKYKDPAIVITENGVCEKSNPNLTIFESLNDTMRKDYLHDHICCLRHAIQEDGINVIGYFVWSLLDNFEWGSGYTVRFGLYYVDFSNLLRYPKYSALWFKSILAKAIQKPEPRIFDQ